jgi:membrane protein implicated in regulation of membrane protease activity
MAGDPNAPIANGYLIFYLALLVGAFVILGAVVLQWHDGSGQGNVFVDILWRLTWVTYQILKVTLIILLLIWISRRFGEKVK